jgi:hypothetical protein
MTHKIYSYAILSIYNYPLKFTIIVNNKLLNAINNPPFWGIYWQRMLGL